MAALLEFLAVMVMLCAVHVSTGEPGTLTSRLLTFFWPTAKSLKVVMPLALAWVLLGPGALAVGNVHVVQVRAPPLPEQVSPLATTRLAAITLASLSPAT